MDIKNLFFGTLFIIQTLTLVAVFVVPIYLFFCGRQGKTYPTAVAILTRVDTLYVALTLVCLAINLSGILIEEMTDRAWSFGLPISFGRFSQSGIIIEYSTAFVGLFSVFCKYVMIPFKAMRGLFSTPSVSKFAAVAYLLSTLVVLMFNIMTCVNILLFSTVFVGLFYLLVFKMDILSMAFGSSGGSSDDSSDGSSGGSSGSGHRCCQTCRQYNYSQCYENPGVTINDPGGRCCGSYNPR